MTKSVTSQEFWQLVGIICAGRENRKMQDSLERAFCAITEDRINDGVFADIIWDDEDIVSTLKSHVTIKERS